MDWNTIVISLIGSIVTGIFSYIASTKDFKLKMKVVESEYSLKIKNLETEIEKQKNNHLQKMELLQKEFELSKEKQNDDMSTQLAEKFMNGELDMEQLAKDIGPLINFSKMFNQKD